LRFIKSFALGGANLAFSILPTFNKHKVHSLLTLVLP